MFSELLCVPVSSITHETEMSIYLDKLGHVQVVINCCYSIAPMCTRKDTLAHSFSAPCLDDDMSSQQNAYYFQVT